MVDHHVASHWDPERSKPDHNLMLASTSGDDYRTQTLHCCGVDNPYDVVAGRAHGTCGWVSPRIKPARWQEKHITDAFERHVADVEQNGQLVHGRAGEERCRCYYCRHGQTPEEMHGQGSTGSAPYVSGGDSGA